MEKLSVVIITLNEEKRIARLLNDLCQQTYQGFEVILVDSNSDDATIDIAYSFVDKLPKLIIHKMHTRGVSLGRNTGAAIANHERLLFLDADVRIDSYFIENALVELKRKNLLVAGVYMQLNNLPLLQKLCYAAFNVGMFITQFFFPTGIGACIFSTRAMHTKLNGFDEQISLCEDCDYLNRASKQVHFRFIKQSFAFDPRRLNQDGMFTMGLTYLKANCRRFFIGEMRNNEIDYPFGHYTEQHKK